MKVLKITLLGLLYALIVACNNKEQKNKNTEEVTAVKSSENKEKPHWSYEGETVPEHWAEFEEDSDCGGKFQSPINIMSSDAKVNASLKELDINYKSQTKIHDVVNNGHSIQYNFERGDYLNHKGKRFDLKQIHFHESSEHTIDGIRYPMVIHMVHVSQDKEFAVLAIMVKEGESSAPFKFLESYLPLQKGQTKTVDASFDLSQNLPKNKGYFNYVGSLTTPPCTEGVNWFVFKNPITISLKQVKVLQKLMPLNNYRNEQPLNGRQVMKTK